MISSDSISTNIYSSFLSQRIDGPNQAWEFFKDSEKQEEQETMRSKDTEFANIKLPRCLVCGGVNVTW